MPRTGSEISEIYARHLKTVYRVCYAYMKNPADTEDAVQDTFVRLIRSAPVFASEEHEKAWLIRTASNVCKNALRHWWRKRENIEDYTNLAGESTLEIDEVFQAVMALPEKYKTVVYLYYYEGYTGAEIADLLQKPASTVRNYLHEARGILRERLGEDFNEE
ncbi:MAG: RNA polymerase sigma factor [Lachnospiraceae bacterium]|nr:RNA polymerase sigma factor [Lachnospiraceae bacterium]